MCVVKGICPECGEIVDCGSIVCDENSDIVFEKPPSELPTAGRCLVLFHPRKPGHRATYVIDAKTQEVREIHCDGSLRPPTEIIPIH